MYIRLLPILRILAITLAEILVWEILGYTVARINITAKIQIRIYMRVQNPVDLLTRNATDIL